MDYMVLTLDGRLDILDYIAVICEGLVLIKDIRLNHNY
jgi:hypothetical protein